MTALAKHSGTLSVLYRLESTLLLLLAALFPLYQKGIPPLLVLWAVSRMALCFLQKERGWREPFLFCVLSGAFYLIHGLGALYSTDLSAGLFDLEKKLSFLILPLLLAMDTGKTGREKVMGAFLAGNLLAVLICGVHVITNYWTWPEKTYLLWGGHFSVLMHTGYFALYLCFAIFLSLYFLVVKGVRSGWVRGLSITGLPVFLVAVLLTRSKAAFLILVMGVLAFGFWVLMHAPKRRALLGVIGSFLGFLILLLVLVPGLLDRFRVAWDHAVHQPIDKEDPGSTEVRLLAWDASLAVIGKAPIFGVGTGDVEKELKTVYDKRGYGDRMYERKDPHCQYLHTMLALGVPGLALLLGVIGYPLVHAWKIRDVLPGVLGAMILIAALFESVFESQAGIVFFAFFTSVALFLRE